MRKVFPFAINLPLAECFTNLMQDKVRKFIQLCKDKKGFTLCCFYEISKMLAQLQLNIKNDLFFWLSYYMEPCNYGFIRFRSAINVPIS